MSQLALSVEFIDLEMAGTTEATTSGMLTKGQDISNCVPFMSHYCENESWDGQMTDYWFTDVGGPAINARRTTPRDNTIYIKGYVVEFDPEKVKVYQGDIPTTINYNSETSVTVTTASGAYDTSRTAMKFYYRVDGSSNPTYPGQFLVRGQVVDGTSISFNKHVNVANTHYGHYFMFESIDDDFTVEHNSGTFTGGIGIEVPVYDWHNSFLICSNSTSWNGTGTDYATMRAYLWGNSRIHMNRQSSSYTCYYNTQLIEFSNEATLSGVRYCPKITNYHSMNTTTTERTLTHRENHIQNSDTLMMSVTQNPTRNASTTQNNQEGAFHAIWCTNSGTQYIIKRAVSTFYAYPTYYLIDWNGQYPQYPDLGTNPAPIASGTSPVKSVENIVTNIAEHVEVVHLSKGQDVANCIVFESGFSNKTSSYEQYYQHEAMTYFRGNELYIERGNEGWDRHTDLSVVEFYPDQVRVQQGQFIIDRNATETTVTLDYEIDIEKTFLVFGHFMGGSEGQWGYHQVLGYTQNTTTLHFSRGTASTYPIMGSWYIAEDLGDNWDVKRVNTGFSSFSSYSYEWPWHASIYNTFVLISNKIDTTNGAPIYSTWRTFNHGPLDSGRVDRYSNSYNTQVGIQVIKFTNDDRIRTHYSARNLTGTEESETYTPYTAMSGMNVTAVLSSLNGQYRTNSTSSSRSVCAFARIHYDEDTNQVTLSRNNGSNYSVTSEATIYTVAWEGFESNTGDKEIDNYGYFIKSIDRHTYTGSTRRWQTRIENGQDLNNCIPITTCGIGETAAADLERMFFTPWIYPDLGRIHYEAYWTPNNPGIDMALQLLEFDPEQVKVQRGYTYLWNGAATATNVIEEVDITKTFMMHYVYVSDNVGTTFGGASIAGKINTSTELHFERGNTTGSTMITWYVVECLQDQWVVQHGEINNSNTTYYTWDCIDMPEHRSITWMSYAQEQTQFYPSYCMFRTYANHDQRGIYQVRGNRQSSGSEVERMNFSGITFNENLGIYVDHVHFYFGTSATSVTVDLNREYDMNRTVFWAGQAQSMMRTNTTSTSVGPQHGYFKAEFQDSTTLLVTRNVSSPAYESWGHVYLIEIPLPTYKVAGVVREKGSFVERTLHLHRSDTGEFMAKTTSSGIDGTYEFLTTYSGSTYVVCFDDVEGTQYNGLIETEVFPTVLTGTWAADQGWV